MSVPEGKRKTSKLDALIKAKSLTAYTLQICANEKTFPPQYRGIITDDIVKLAKDIFIVAWTANNIYVKEDPAKWERRKSLQAQAISKCESLLVLIQIAQETMHLSSKRVKYWGEKVLEVRGLLRGWYNSDCNRYDYLLKEK